MAVIDKDDRTCFGPYRIVRRIGSGGMGCVFEAEDTGLGHRVALKLLHPHVAERPGAARRFLREGRAAARIRHPHVVQVFALGTDGGTPYLAMELLDGGSLLSLIECKRPLSIEGALDVILPVIAAVAAAHEAGVIHRDLKPSNVCLTHGPAGRPWPKVVDFGVSKVVSAAGLNEATVTDSVIGTAAYMAPEQARAASDASFHSDQYSLGVMLYQCVTGELPFGGRSVYEVLESVMAAPVLPPSARASQIPKELDQAVLRAMSRNPNERFPSVRALGASLLSVASAAARAAYAAELSAHEATESGVVVPSQRSPAPIVAGAATPIADSTAPPDSTTPATGNDHERKTSRVKRHAGWLGLPALTIIALIVTSIARPRANDPSTEITEETSHGSAAVSASSTAPPRDQQFPVEPLLRKPEVSPSASAIPMARPPDPAQSVSPPRGRSQPRFRREPTISFGDNGAPILP